MNQHGGTNQRDIGIFSANKHQNQILHVSLVTVEREDMMGIDCLGEAMG